MTCKDCIHDGLCRQQEELCADGCEQGDNKADYKKIVRGKWIPFHSKIAGNMQYCSACGIGSENRSDFCPHCGADMRYRGE